MRLFRNMDKSMKIFRKQEMDLRRWLAISTDNFLDNPNHLADPKYNALYFFESCRCGRDGGETCSLKNVQPPYTIAMDSAMYKSSQFNPKGLYFDSTAL